MARRDRDLDECLDPKDRNNSLKHFLPRFANSPPSLETASAIFGTFVFRKADPGALGPGQAVPGPPAGGAPPQPAGSKRRNEEI